MTNATSSLFLPSPFDTMCFTPKNTLTVAAGGREYSPVRKAATGCGLYLGVILVVRSICLVKVASCMILL